MDFGLTQDESTLELETIGRIGDLCNSQPLLYVDLFLSECERNPGMVLPVELKNFNVDIEDKSVRLTWETASEINNQHFLIQRSINGVDFETISIVNSLSQNGEGHFYSYLDKEVEPAQQYYF